MTCEGGLIGEWLWPRRDFRSLVAILHYREFTKDSNCNQPTYRLTIGLCKRLQQHMVTLSIRLYS